MFQNISGQAENESINENEFTEKNNKIKLFLKNAFTKQKIAIYILSFMVSMVEGINGMTPFAISIFAATLSNKIPALIVYVITLIATFIGQGANSALIYLLTSLVFIVLTLIFKPKESTEFENEKLKLGKFVFISTLLVQLVIARYKPIFSI